VSEPDDTFKSLPHWISGGRGVAVRVWGLAGDRLVEVAACPGDTLRIEGLPPGRARSTADRLRAALVNAGVVDEVPGALVTLDPPMRAGPSADLDLPIAISLLLRGAGAGWILAVGRLGLDGAVCVDGLEERVTVADVVRVVCQTHGVRFEQMFERGD
jgi:hypothetical protein